MPTKSFHTICGIAVEHITAYGSGRHIGTLIQQHMACVKHCKIVYDKKSYYIGKICTNLNHI